MTAGATAEGWGVYCLILLTGPMIGPPAGALPGGGGPPSPKDALGPLPAGGWEGGGGGGGVPGKPAGGPGGPGLGGGGGLRAGEAVGGGEKGYQNGGEVVPCQGSRSE